jgi:hypothetical protein
MKKKNYVKYLEDLIDCMGKDDQYLGNFVSRVYEKQLSF